MDERKLLERLTADPEVSASAGLAELGVAAFAYATVLLDDDENLTRIGNPTGEARGKLRARIEEWLATTGADEPGADEPGADEPGADEPGADEPGADEP